MTPSPGSSSGISSSPAAPPDSSTSSTGTAAAPWPRRSLTSWLPSSRNRPSPPGTSAATSTGRTWPPSASPRQPPPVQRTGKTSPPPRKPNKKGRFLYPLLAAGLFTFPALFLLSFTPEWLSSGFWQPPILQRFLLRFNYFFGWYSLALNGSYLILLGFSAYGIRRQYRLWRLKSRRLLFKPDILPAITILAPAFNEEGSITESINSLLSLDYPDFEVVVINDGSSDRTLERCIQYFQLERIDKKPRGRLASAPLRGIYHNRRYPRLFVLDKVNGGKADSLNLGINYAEGDFLAGIDSDSLLEPDALLKLTAPFLDEDTEVAATGGNIFPVNGCTVRRGHITAKGVPRSGLARPQTAEYIRAFMAGRVGWSVLRALLIISGAFGLFQRKRVIENHGYLTGREFYHRDTVGEDMELVVRLHQNLTRRGLAFRILYQFNANCWTEVPEAWGALIRQRDRWQRGLIETLHFHRRMILNPRYGSSGVLGFPYYLLFEIVGPLWEVQGYAVFFLALFLGILKLPIILFLLTATILFGILVSLTALLLSEKEIVSFSPRDKARLLAAVLWENAGPRQLISQIRVKGFFSALRNRRGWGTIKRRGFGPAAPPKKGE